MSDFDPHAFIRENDKLEILKLGTVGWGVAAGLVEGAYKAARAQALEESQSLGKKLNDKEREHLKFYREVCLGSKTHSKNDYDGAGPSTQAQGVFKGADGLEGLANAQEFWDEQPYGTRLYFGDGVNDYLHRDVLRAAIRALQHAAPSQDKGGGG